MELRRASLPVFCLDRLVAAFPGKRAASGSSADRGPRSEPVAAISLAPRGDMKFADPALAPNRELFLRGLGLEPGLSRGLSLVHSRNVLFLEQGDDAQALAAASGGADGLVALDRALAPTVTVADCMPIWILDRDSGAFGVLHSGWKGTGILAAAVRELVRRFGSRPSSMAAILGPAIGSCCYAVPPERAEAFAAEFGPSSVLRRGDELFLDLRAANVALAESIGIGALLSIEACTSCDLRLGSYRRQGSAAFTRMLAVCAYSGAVPDIDVSRN